MDSELADVIPIDEARRVAGYLRLAHAMGLELVSPYPDPPPVVNPDGTITRPIRRTDRCRGRASTRSLPA